MWQAAGYYDESDDNEKAYAVAGFIGHQHDCVHFDLAWRERILNKYGIKYFKASELNSGTGEFARFRDNPKELTARFSEREKALFNQIKIETIDLIVEFDTLVGIGAVLLLPDYHRLVGEYASIGKMLLAPYHFCANTMMMESGFIMQKLNASSRPLQYGLLRPVFDSHEQYSGRTKQMFDEFRRNNPITSEFLLPPIYESDQDYLMLQAADNLAYESRRLVISTDFDTHIPERKAMKRLKERVYKIYKLNYVGLKMICEAQEPESIPFEINIHNRQELLRKLEDIQESVHESNTREQAKSAAIR